MQTTQGPSSVQTRFTPEQSQPLHVQKFKERVESVLEKNRIKQNLLLEQRNHLKRHLIQLLTMKCQQERESSIQSYTSYLNQLLKVMDRFQDSLLVWQQVVEPHVSQRSIQVSAEVNAIERLVGDMEVRLSTLVRVMVQVHEKIRILEEVAFTS